MYADKSFSQKVAIIFVIGSIVMLIPAGFGLIFAAVIFFASLFSGNVSGILFGSVPFALTAIGVAMLIGYLRQSQGRLEDRYKLSLWAASFVFNIAPLLPIAHYVQVTPGARLYQGGGFAFLPILLWWAVASVLSAAAFVENYRDRVR